MAPKPNKMVADKVHLRHCILYEFQRGSSASVASQHLCEVFGKDSVTARTCQRWFSKFRSGDLNVEEESRIGRPPKIDDEALLEVLEESPHLTITDIGKKLGVHHSTVSEHIERLRLKKVTQVENLTYLPKKRKKLTRSPTN